MPAPAAPAARRSPRFNYLWLPAAAFLDVRAAPRSVAPAHPAVPAVPAVAPGATGMPHVGVRVGMQIGRNDQEAGASPGGPGTRAVATPTVRAASHDELASQNEQTRAMGSHAPRQRRRATIGSGRLMPATSVGIRGDQFAG